MQYFKRLLLFGMCFWALPLFAQPTQVAYFAGGCFWCMQPPFDKTPGVVKTVVGYLGGTRPGPTYELVASGRTHYAESIAVTYNPKRVSYQKLLTIFWHNVDPIQTNGQFCDHGRQYRAEIFYSNPSQQRLAQQSKQKLVASKRFKQPIVVDITQAGKFYPAETYHQDYYKKNPLRYQYYHFRCGRAQTLKRLWG